MSDTATVAEKWNGFKEKASPVLEKIESVIGLIWSWIFRLRKIAMAVPVVYYAIRLANQNMERLPEMVGFNLLSNGNFSMMIERSYAVYGPVALTVFCLALMFCSRKTVFPWVVSIFTLAVPYLIRITNLFNA